MESAVSQDWEPKILAFLCNWCSYAGADLAGVSRFQYPANIRVIRIPCSGRMNPAFIVNALNKESTACWCPDVIRETATT